MAIPRIIKIKEGNTNGKVTYHYWEEYETYEQAKQEAIRLKQERKKDKMKIKYYIKETEDSWFLPSIKYVVYINYKLRLL